MKIRNRGESTRTPSIRNTVSGETQQRIRRSNAASGSLHCRSAWRTGWQSHNATMRPRWLPASLPSFALTVGSMRLGGRRSRRSPPSESVTPSPSRHSATATRCRSLSPKRSQVVFRQLRGCFHAASPPPAAGGGARCAIRNCWCKGRVHTCKGVKVSSCKCTQESYLHWQSAQMIDGAHTITH